MSQRICSIDGCEKPAKQRGWCGMHYERWRTSGDVGEVAPRFARQSGPCSVEWCEKPARTKGFCGGHYSNLKQQGHAVAVRDLPLDERLKIVGWDVTASGCWEWRGQKSEKGYGVFNAHRLGYVYARAHRAMWEMRNGLIPDGLVIRHRCDNPPCVNPDHLDVGTVAQNQADMVERGRSVAYATGRYDGVCVNGRHDVTQPGALREVRKSGSTHMQCVECDQDRKRKYEDKKKAERVARKKGI